MAAACPAPHSGVGNRTYHSGKVSPPAARRTDRRPVRRHAPPLLPTPLRPVYVSAILLPRSRHAEHRNRPKLQHTVHTPRHPPS